MKRLALPFMLVIITLTALIFLSTGTYSSDDEPQKIIEKMYEKALLVKNFQADILIFKLDPEFLGKYFPEAKSIQGAVPYKGKLSFYRPADIFNLMIEVPPDRKLHMMSNNGLSFVLREPFTAITPAITTPIPSPTEASPTEAASVSPSPSPSPSPSSTAGGVRFTPFVPATHSPQVTQTVPGMTIPGATKSTFTGDVTMDMHPLSLVFPLPFKPRATEDFVEIAGSEKLYEEDCNIINIGGSRGEFTLWVSKINGYIMKMRYYDESGREIAGYYKNFNDFEKNGVKYYFFQGMQVTVDNKIIYEAELSSFEINGEKTKVFGYVDPSEMWKFTSSSFRYHHPPKRVEGPEKEIHILSPVASTVVIFLLMGLVYYMYRYLKHVTARKLFATEIIVVEKEDKRLSKAIASLGFTTVPFSPDLISEQRTLLGRKKDMELPKIIIFENDSSVTIKNHLYLVKAYVEEGGRVIILPHGVGDITNMPVTPAFLPMKKFDEGMTFNVKSKIWRKTKTAELEKNIYPFSPEQLYLKVNNKDFDREMVVSYNKISGVKGVLVGIFREGKGEYLLCQLDILKTILETQHMVGMAKMALYDMLMWMFGYEEGAPPKPKDAAKEKGSVQKPPSKMHTREPVTK